MVLTENLAALRDKIESKHSRVCIIGLGQVGLPTSLSFLKAGFKVTGYDINEGLIKTLQKGENNSPEKDFDELINKFVGNSSFTLTTDPKSLASSDVIILCVPTPLDAKSHKAELKFLRNAISEVAKFLNGEKLVIVESSVPPRTMKEFIIPTLERLSGKRAGEDFLVSFCPERIAPGNSMKEFYENDRIIGSNDDDSYLATYLLFKDLTNGKIYRADTTTAEISKLAENSYRDVNIAFANELAVICEHFEVDVMEVIRIANTHPRVNIHRPGAGVGGPCLPKDPYLLLTGKGLKTSLIETARMLNDSMPAHIAQILTDTIGVNQIDRRNIKILILGTSYKPNTSDSRNSPTGGIVLALKQAGFVNISVHDPYSDESFGGNLITDLYSGVRNSDCIIIATGHSAYSSFSPANFRKGCTIIDAARVLDKSNFISGEMKYVSL